MGISMKSTTGKVLASVALVGTAAAVAGLGTYGAFTDTTTAEQQVTAGDIEIGLNDTATLTAPVQNLLPGDSVEQFATLSNSGDSALNTVSLTTTGTGSLLETDPNGLRIAIEACPTAWTPVASGPDLCGGTNGTPVLATSKIILSEVSLTGLSSLTPGGLDHLKITTSLPGVAGDVLQKATSVITLKFDATQRTGTVK